MGQVLGLYFRSLPKDDFVLTGAKFELILVPVIADCYK